MTSNIPDPADRGDGFDWDRYEAEVVDLDAARTRRAGQPDNTPDSGPDSGADTGPDTGDDIDPATTGPLMVDSVAAQRRPRFTLAGLRDGKRRPVIPTWLRSRAELAGNATWLAGFAGH